ELNSWGGTSEGADPKFADPARLRCWRRMIGDPDLASMLSAGLLYIDDAPISFSFGLKCGTTRYSIATSYDQAFARHSPGSVVGYRTYMEAVQRGVRILDLGSGDGGEKTGMGAVQGSPIMDYLFLRSSALAALARPFW